MKVEKKIILLALQQFIYFEDDNVTVQGYSKIYQRLRCQGLIFFLKAERKYNNTEIITQSQ